MQTAYRYDDDYCNAIENINFPFGKHISFNKSVIDKTVFIVLWELIIFSSWLLFNISRHYCAAGTENFMITELYFFILFMQNHLHPDSNEAAFMDNFFVYVKENVCIYNNCHMTVFEPPHFRRCILKADCIHIYWQILSCSVNYHGTNARNLTIKYMCVFIHTE